ncbi:hypothetical protein [uncultured Desulfuromonas sp.]|uniref:hypothetical protein n=1 Tax=uncultured Desulfuromonas sp. TaxID=181013 RepID=UPI002AAAA49E|nr:hypothetical protein [uncultured Desulfuromonas sp.]
MDGLLDFLISLWVTFKEFVLDTLYLLFDVILTAVETAVTSIPVPEILTTFDPWSWVNPQAAYVLDALNIALVLGILLAGYTIRFALNLIPAAFTRV